MTANLQKARKRRPRADGAVHTAVAVQVSATATCPICGFRSPERGVRLHMEEAHADGQSPRTASGGSGESGAPNRPRSPGPPNGSHEKAYTVHLKGRRSGSSRTAQSTRSAHSDQSAASQGRQGSAGDSSDCDGDNEKPRFAECPVDGCYETILEPEMAFHIDLHAALEYQERATYGEEDANGATAPEDAQTTPRTASATAINGSRGGQEARSGIDSTLAGAQTNGRSSTSRSGGQKRRVSFARSAPDHAPQPNDADDARHRNRQSKSQEHHREQRERQREHQRSRGRHRSRQNDRRRNTEAGKTTPDVHDGPQDATLSLKPANAIRSWLAFWAGGAPAKHHPASEGKSPAAPSKSSSKSPVSEGDEPKRLGKAELGKYADEERMPDALAIYLKKEWGVSHQGIIPVLKQLLEQSATTDHAYLCDPCVQHVSRLPKEGGFCGYRNIQTMVSYVVGAKFTGHELFGKTLPSVFDIQNLIENAWDMGINPRGRIETGGIRLTRKYIGTPEAVAMFHSLKIPVSVSAFKHKSAGRARDLLLRDIEEYFRKGNYQPGEKIRTTTLPPIYWQHPGHSLTIVGIEKTHAGETNLLVFDPIFRDGSTIARLVGRRNIEYHFPDQLLKPYRRGPRYLSRFRAFEVLKFQPRPEDVVDIVPTVLPLRPMQP